MWSSGSTNPLNNDGDAAFDGKEHDFNVKKPSLKIDLITALLSAAGPSNAAASPTYEKSSFIDDSQLHDDPNMPELKDITYSDDEDDVGAEADFNNLETFITVSPIPTTRFHKDHLVSQIIGDLSLTTQTKSMTRVVKDQGESSQMFNDDFYTLKQKKDEIFISQDKYVAEILRKFRLTEGKLTSTPIDTEKPLLKDPDDLLTKAFDVGRFQYLVASIGLLNLLGIKSTRHSHCQLWSSYCQKKFPLPVKKVPPAEEKKCHYRKDCTATKVKKQEPLLLALLDEQQLRFSKHKTAHKLWAVILKTFGGNEATKKMKKNLLKQQYGNFKAEGSETLEQTFSRLHVIVSHLEFIDIEIEQDDLNQKFLTTLAPEWLMHTIVWRNKSDLNTMSLDDLYNHLKVYESEVLKKSESNSQNMAFISSAKHSSGNEEVNTASVSTASTNVSTTSANIRAASISQDTTCAYIASQSSENHAFVADEEAPTEFALMSKTSAESEVKARLAEHRNQEVKYYEKIRVLEFKTESRANCIESLTKELELIKKEKEGLDSKLAGFQTASKDLDNLLESQRSDKSKEGLGYSAVPPPPVQIYSPPKKELSWIGLPEFADDIVTDYSRPSPVVESTTHDLQNRDPSVTETGASPTESDSLPHVHAQATKTYYNHQDLRVKKAQELKTNTFRNSDIKDPSLETKLRGRLLERFQDDAKHEHVSQDTRSQGGKED
nr:hypothetical protein [Tanacetum cinerariifolium]